VNGFACSEFAPTVPIRLLVPCLCVLVTAASAADEVASHFVNAPEQSLIRKLEPATAADDSKAGLTVTRRYRWLPELPALLIEGEVANGGKAATQVGEIPALDLAFRVHDRKEDAPYEKLTYRNEEWYGSTFWTGPDWTRVGKDWHHPGQNTPSVRCFRVPREGRLTITGPVRKLHLDGDGVAVSIRHEGRQVWKAEIDGKDDKGVEPNLTLAVRQGDAIRFVVDKRGEIFCDTTYWDPVLTYADGEQLQASKGFSTTKQGEGGWFYEMLTETDPEPAPPTLHCLGADLSLREAALTKARPFELGRPEGLPFFVLEDGLEESGVALALEPAGAWSVRAALDEKGLLRVQLLVGERDAPRTLAAGAKLSLPPVLLAAHAGPWTESIALLNRLVGGTPEAVQMDALAAAVRNAYTRATQALARKLDLDLLLTAQTEWRREDKIAETAESYSAAIADHLERARRLLSAFKEDQPDGFLAAQSARLDQLTGSATRADQSLGERRGLYLRTRLLKREIALSNPLLDYNELLLCKRQPASYSHLVMQYYGWRARPGGGLFVLDKPGYSLAARSVLGDQLPRGSVLEPRLSYDGKRVVFAFVACPDTPYRPEQLTVNEEGPDEGYYHLYEANVDGTGLRQLTAGPYDDLMPAYLPDGGIVFCSTRRRGYSRCFGGQFSKRWDSYTLHRVDRDGTNLQALSCNDVNEWFPAVSNAGDIVYARWDYIDRDAVTHQNLWATRPDGTNTMAVWGNASPKPHCTFQVRPVPGSSKLAFIASAHHAITGGPLCLVDPSVDNNSLEAVTRITPGAFPEAEGWNVPEYYESPWPLSERYFLVAYSAKQLINEGQGPNPPNALGLYLLDAAGNRELLYRDPQISSMNPTPLRPRPTPPALSRTAPPDAPPTGEMLVTDVYQGLGDIPRGSLKELRIVQIFPKTTPWANTPRIGLAGEENTRAILGTVPVEADGSARFLLPARKSVLFQALDRDGFAYQTMRSLVYVQPGERVSCLGCHESRKDAPPSGAAAAMRRPPSTLDPGGLGGEPFSFMRVVQPVLDKHCAKCHSGEKPAKGMDLTGTPLNGFTRSYWSLCGSVEDFTGGQMTPEAAAAALVPRFGQRNQVQTTPPGGLYGALGSQLMRLLRAGHNDVALSESDLRRLAAWIDCNAVFYGAYDPEAQARQLAGERIAMPEIQ
jgi:hypothetical protein